MILAAVAILGLLFGSFTNVLIARVPVGKQTVRGRSACPQCGHEIAWYDNIPVLSWLVLRGRCRSCRGPISPVYPAVELAVALLWVGVYLLYGLTWTSLLLAYVAVVSVALVVIDIRHRRLPHRIVLPSYPVVIVAAAGAWFVGESRTWVSAVVGLAALAGFYGLLWLVYPKGMGFGDVTTAGLLGWTAGFLGWQQLAVAAIAGPLVGGVIVIVLLLRGRAGRKTAIPYGPALVIGAWIGVLAGPSIAQAYLRLLGLG